MATMSKTNSVKINPDGFTFQKESILYTDIVNGGRQLIARNYAASSSAIIPTHVGILLRRRHGDTLIACEEIPSLKVSIKADQIARSRAFKAAADGLSELHMEFNNNVGFYVVNTLDPDTKEVDNICIVSSRSSLEALLRVAVDYGQRSVDWRPGRVKKLYNINSRVLMVVPVK